MLQEEILISRKTLERSQSKEKIKNITEDEIIEKLPKKHFLTL